MSLPACQQRILDGIAGMLQARDPRLASMFVIFSRLSRTEPMPANEALDASRLRQAVQRLRRRAATAPRLRALLIIPVVIAAVTGLVLLGPVAGGARSCGQALAGRAYVQLAGRFGTCRVIPATPGGGVAGRQR